MGTRVPLHASPLDRFHAEQFRWPFRLALRRYTPIPQGTQVDLAAFRTA